MAKLINCPYCNSNLTIEAPIFTLHCSNCGATFRLRNGKSYKNEEVVPEMLGCIIAIFASIAKADAEQGSKYDEYVEKFISKEQLTKAQYKDAVQLYKSERKSVFGIQGNKYKEIMIELKRFIDLAYSGEIRQNQEKLEDSLFYMFYSLMNITGSINVSQNKILQFYKTTFEYTEERYQNFIGQISVAEKSKIKAETSADDTFNGIMGKLEGEYTTQREFITSLIAAFKRPFVLKENTGYLKNAIGIFTSEGEFAQKAVEEIAELMFQETLIQGKEAVMDLSKYSENIKFNEFLTELYNQLNSVIEVVVFRDFKAASGDVRKVIGELIKNGKYRYCLGKETVDINTNNKYFIFISSGEVENFAASIGQEAFEKISDIIKVDDLKEEDISKMIEDSVVNLVYKVRETLQIPLKYDAGLLEFLKKTYAKRTGIKGINIYIEQNIYKPLTEFKLKRVMPITADVILGVLNDELVIAVDGSAILLQKFNHRKKNAGVEEVKKKLNKIIGLDTVKEYVLKLEDSATAKLLREEAGLKTSSISMNMIFTGNPGTGKTTIARIIAEFLAAIGILEKGQLVEVSRGDLVGEHVGETAKKTAAKINEALGGVLFIDEAYALCRDKRDTFGLEAIDTLVKMMEDNKDRLVVILAGYVDEMTEFLKSNTGLKSRFPNIVEFPDYTPEEMYRIANEIAESNQYIIDNTCIEPLITYFEGKNIKGKNDIGNGRLARNMVEKAILNQSQRILQENETDYELLKLSDFELEEKEDFDLEAHMDGIIGLDNVKDFLRKQYNVLKAQEKRKEAGIVTDVSQSLNMVFTGNPGTGKTTVARVVAEMLKEIGVLKSGNLVEADRSKLVAEYVGQTAIKTTEIFKSALGGVLFIDEAYALSAANDNFGKEAIDTLVKLIEDFRGEIVVILAGYKKEMREFLSANSGLESRFPLVIDFPDYSSEELFDIFKLMVKSKGFVMGEEEEKFAFEKIQCLHKNATESSGNGRMIRNFTDEIIRNQSNRIATGEVLLEDTNKIILEDLGENEDINKVEFDYEAEFSKITGLDTVKDYIRSIVARIRITQARKEMGLVTSNVQTLHMIFTGNPGTGKTMMARTVAKLFYSLGVIEQDKVIETDRAGMVAGYVGQTAIKTTEKVKEALGGVLFIDEAYTLSQGGSNDFGKESIDTLVKLMDDNRDRLVVILAGYTNEMKQFLSVNPGLDSRFPNVIEFPDYSLEELVEIGTRMFDNNGYELEAGAVDKLKLILDEVRENSRFGNGRYVRNIFERAINNQAVRVMKLSEVTKDDLVTIAEEDIEKI